MEPTVNPGAKYATKSELVLANAKDSQAQLEAEGFVREATVLAGPDSASYWRHPVTGDTASIAYKNLNLVCYRSIQETLFAAGLITQAQYDANIF